MTDQAPTARRHVPLGAIIAALALSGCVSASDWSEAPRYSDGPAYAYDLPADVRWWGRDASAIDVFYGPLGAYGSWVAHPGYGRVWTPGGVPRGWAPYTIGHWQSDRRYGRRWVSAEPFGWATYHYGRWAQDPRLGWFWVPDTRFSGAWVDWRDHQGYAGWAPLPPIGWDRWSTGLRYSDWYVYAPYGNLWRPGLNQHVWYGNRQQPRPPAVTPQRPPIAGTRPDRRPDYRPDGRPDRGPERGQGWRDPDRRDPEWRERNRPDRQPGDRQPRAGAEDRVPGEWRGRRAEGAQPRRAEGAQARGAEGAQARGAEGAQARGAEGAQARGAEGAQARSAEGQQADRAARAQQRGGEAMRNRDTAGQPTGRPAPVRGQRADGVQGQLPVPQVTNWPQERRIAPAAAPPAAAPVAAPPRPAQRAAPPPRTESAPEAMRSERPSRPMRETGRSRQTP